MYKIFESLMKEKGVSAYKVSVATGISQSTLSDWKKGTYQPKRDKLQKIADYFNVPLEYLETGKYSNIPSEVNMDTFEVIELFEKLNAEQKKAIIALLRSFN